MLKNKALIKLGALLLLAAAIRTKLCVYRVTGSSMAPSLHDGDLVICMKSHRPGKGSIALLHRGSSLMIKRVIAIGGEHLRIDGTGRVYVDSVLLKEPYLRGRRTPDIPLSLTVPNGCVFVMGDNRADCVDSRSPLIGFLHHSRTFAVAFAVLSPKGLDLL